MTNKETKSNSSNQLEANLCHLKELPGLVGKRINVPPDHLGVAVDQKGEVQTFQPGTHTLLTPIDRLLGQGIGLLIGYIPSNTLIVRFHLESLLSGDGHLINGILVCEASILEPGRFLRQLQVQKISIQTTVLDLDPQLIEQTLGAITTDYAATDLISGYLTAKLLSQLQPILEIALSSMGLILEQIQHFIISKAENKILVAQKAQELRERLQDVELQREMADIETQAQLEEFIQQIDPKFGEVAQLSIDHNKDSPKKGKIADAIDHWLQIETGEKTSKHRWRIESLFRSKKDSTKEPSQKKVSRPPRYWWLCRLLWMAFVVFLGVILTIIINKVANAASWNNQLEILLIIWGFVISVLLESLRVLYKKREAYSEEAWSLPGYQHLDNLVGNDRQWADDVVREQCARELKHVRDIVSEIRSREYKLGREERALLLKQVLESSTEKCAEKVLRKDFAVPPYVSDLNVSRHAWEFMLDKDEALLLAANTLSDKAHLLQQHSQEETLTEPLIVDMEKSITNFCNQFFERSRTLQVPHTDSNQK